MNKKLMACLLAGGITMTAINITDAAAEAAAQTGTVQQPETGIAFYGAKELVEVPPSAIQSPNKNPFGLVYQGAITKNEMGKVNIHPVAYLVNGNRIAADIYTPAGYDILQEQDEKL